MAAGEQASVLGHSGPWELSVFPRSPCLWPALSSTAQTQVGGRLDLAVIKISQILYLHLVRGECSFIAVKYK